MSSTSVVPPFPLFGDSDGQPLDAGFIYVGVENLEPISNPVSIYWDYAMTVPASQPIRTLGGYPSRGGTPSRFYTNANYSIVVKDKKSRIVFSSPSVSNDANQVRSDLLNTSNIALGDAMVGVKQPLTGSTARTQHQKNAETFDLYDFGAVGSGLVSDAAAFAAAISSGATEINITNGTFLIDSNQVVPQTVALCFHDGGMLKIANGITVTIGGPVVAGPWQIFSVVGTGLVKFDNPGTIRATQIFAVDLCPDWWGAKGLALNRPSPSGGGQDDTAAVQACFTAAASNRPVRFYRDYPVTQVTLTGNEINVDFDNWYLVGMATTATNSVLEIKCGYSTLSNMKVDVGFNLNYRCGVHWYTNDSSLYYPGFNRIGGLYIRWALIGLVIGGFSDQSEASLNSPDPLASGLATNAPLSESYIIGLVTFQCIQGVFARQPNGKITLVSPHISAFAGSVWSGGSSAYASTLCAITVANATEIYIDGGSLEREDAAFGKLAWIKDFGHLEVLGSCVETFAPVWIEGETKVRFSQIQNGFGINFNGSLFYILNTATGALYLDRTKIDYQASSLGNVTWPFAMCVATFPTSNFSAATPSVNTYYVMHTSQVEFKDTPFWTGANGTSFVPLVRGFRIRIDQGWLTSYNSTPARLFSQWMNEDTDYLTGFVDQSAGIISATPATSSGSAGGWTYTLGNANCNFNRVASGIVIDADTCTTGWQCSSFSAADASVLSAKVFIPAGKARIFRGWIKTGSSANPLVISVKYWGFTGSAASRAFDNLYSGVESNLGTTWQPFIFYFIPPTDAVQCSINFALTNAGFVQIMNPSIQ